MFDPQHPYDQRMATELGVYNQTTFYPCDLDDETELKFLLKPTAFQAIRNQISAQPNRVIDPRTYNAKETALVTYNLDTEDRTIFQNGLSLRVRFSLDLSPHNPRLSDFDISIKSLLDNKTSSYNNYQRLEVEAELQSFHPDLSQLVKQNKPEVQRNIPPVIYDLIEENPTLFVESVGGCFRQSYLSGHKIQNEPIIIAYEHTEDSNLFNSPLCLPCDTVYDFESEAERKGEIGDNLQRYSNEEMNYYRDISLKSTAALIVGAEESIEYNNRTKSNRGYKAVGAFHGYDRTSPALYDSFTQQALDIANYGLSLGMQPEDVPIQYITSQLLELKAQKNRLFTLPQAINMNAPIPKVS